LLVAKELHGGGEVAVQLTGQGAGVSDLQIHQRYVAFVKERTESTEETRTADSRVISIQEADSRPRGTQDGDVVVPPPGGKQGENTVEEGCAIQLTTQERQFLVDVWQHPTSTITQHYHSLQFSPRGGTGVQTSLQAKQLIRSCSIVSGRTRMKILSLTELGKSILGVAEPDADRLGGPEHRYWKSRLAEHLRAAGYDVTGEFPIGGGKAIDLVASRDGRRIALEIETGKADVVANVNKCLAAGMQEVLVVTTSGNVKQAILPAIPHESKVVVVTAPEALAML
jgi:hypothetical protein